MKTVTIDKSGKLYLPQSVRDKAKERTFSVAVLPTGTIMLHKARRIRDPALALKEFQKLPRVTKSIAKIKAEVEEYARRSVK